jgi:hypothetical protein
MKLKLHEIELNAKDPEASKKFYSMVKENDLLEKLLANKSLQRTANRRC